MSVSAKFTILSFSFHAIRSNLCIKGVVFVGLKMRVTKKLKMAYFRQNVCGIQSFIKYNKYHSCLFQRAFVRNLRMSMLMLMLMYRLMCRS